VPHRMSAFWRFVLENDANLEDAIIIWYIQEGEWQAARLATQQLIARTR
jgi:hypothetical protein